MLGRRKGASKVVQMVIVVVAIFVSYYVAQNMLGSVQEAAPTDEAIDFVNITVANDAFTNWQVTISLANPGTSTVTLKKALVNGLEVSKYSAESPSEIAATLTTDLTEETGLVSGEIISIKIWVGRQFGFFSSGSVLDIQFGSSEGNEFVKTVILP